MKFTLHWLKDHLDTDSALPEIVDKLTMIGLEVENVEDKAAQLKPLVIASVLSAEKHPNADRLRVCMVDTGDGKPIQVVCGAPNARAGMKAAKKSRSVSAKSATSRAGACSFRARRSRSPTITTALSTCLPMPRSASLMGNGRVSAIL